MPTNLYSVHNLRIYATNPQPILDKTYRKAEELVHAYEIAPNLESFHSRKGTKRKPHPNRVLGDEHVSK